MSNKFTGTGPANGAPRSHCEKPLRAIPPPRTVFDVQIVQRGRRWKWQVRNPYALVVLQGWEKSRSLARYQGYRALLLLLRTSCLTPLRADNSDAAWQADGDATEKGRPVARTAFPVSRRRHI